MPGKGRELGRGAEGTVLKGPDLGLPHPVCPPVIWGVKRQTSQPQDCQRKHVPQNWGSQLNPEILRALDLAMEGTSWGELCEPPTLPS